MRGLMKIVGQPCWYSVSPVFLSPTTKRKALVGPLRDLLWSWQFGQGVWCLILPWRTKRWETGWLAALTEGWRRSWYAGVWLHPPSVQGENVWVFAETVCANDFRVCFRGSEGPWTKRKLGWTATCQRTVEGVGNQGEQRYSSRQRNRGQEKPGKKNRVSTGHVGGPWWREPAGNVSHASKADSQLTTALLNKELPYSSMPKALEHQPMCEREKWKKIRPSSYPWSLASPYGIGQAEIPIKSVFCYLKQL